MKRRQRTYEVEEVLALCGGPSRTQLEYARRQLGLPPPEKSKPHGGRGAKAMWPESSVRILVEHFTAEPRQRLRDAALARVEDPTLREMLAGAMSGIDPVASKGGLNVMVDVIEKGFITVLRRELPRALVSTLLFRLADSGASADFLAAVAEALDGDALTSAYLDVHPDIDDHALIIGEGNASVVPASTVLDAADGAFVYRALDIINHARRVAGLGEHEPDELEASPKA